MNFQLLNDILDANLDVPESGFNMGIFMNGCGTRGCMIGNATLKGKIKGFSFYMKEGKFGCLMTRPDHYRWGIFNVDEIFEDISKILGISINEANWLYGACEDDRYKNIQPKGPALARLAKFIIYKKRKAKLLEDYEAARRHEGNGFFCDVKDEVKELITK